MSTLHVLLDPSGAYLCLDYSLVCSHLDSLYLRVAGTLARGDFYKKAAPEKWTAYEAAEKRTPATTVNLGVSGAFDVDLRQTEKWVIMPKPN